MPLLDARCAHVSGGGSRPHLWGTVYLCLRMVRAWICRRDVAGRALKGTSRGIKTSSGLVELYPCYSIEGKVHANIASMHCSESRIDMG